MKNEIELSLSKKEYELERDLLVKEFETRLKDANQSTPFNFKLLVDKYNPEGLMSLQNDSHLNCIFIRLEEGKIKTISDYCREDIRYQHHWIILNKMVKDNPEIFKNTLKLGLKYDQLNEKNNEEYFYFSKKQAELYKQMEDEGVRCIGAKIKTHLNTCLINKEEKYFTQISNPEDIKKSKFSDMTFVGKGHICKINNIMRNSAKTKEISSVLPDSISDLNNFVKVASFKNIIKTKKPKF